MKKPNRKTRKKTRKSNKKINATPADFIKILHLEVVNEDFEKAKAENRSPVVKTVTLFGSNLFPVESNPDNIMVLESDYIHVKKYLLSHNLTTCGFRIEVDDCDDISKDEEMKKNLVWRIVKSNIFGGVGSYPLDASIYFNEKQEIRNAVDVKPYQIKIDGDVSIEIKVRSKIGIAFYFKQEGVTIDNTKRRNRKSKKRKSARKK